MNLRPQVPKTRIITKLDYDPDESALLLTPIKGSLLMILNNIQNLE
ncbi:MAG: hypothetical protein YK1309IOTA_1410002 [Marine Group I thaumarchaeote]|nr:MAG: hypothetical protein YK1309IOTA_1410002 [Marine Group I thaumarchaeote]